MKNEKTKKIIKVIKDNYLFVLLFILINVLSSYFLRVFTTREYFNIRPLLADLGFFALLSLISLTIKRKKRGRYFVIVSLVLSIICVINSIYYQVFRQKQTF